MKKILLLLFCIVLITFGIARGEVNNIYNKASTICLECIGLGR